MSAVLPARLQRLGRVLAPAAVVGYILLGARQLLTLTPAALEFDFRQFYIGAVDLAAGRDPYRAYLACCQGSLLVPLKGYIYPPLLGMLMRPLVGLAEGPAALAWYVLLQASLVGAVVAADRGLGSLLSPAARNWLLAGSLLFPPLLINLGFMQVGTIVILLMVLAGVAYLRPRTTPLAGIAVAAGAALRVSPALAALAFVRRERASLGALILGATVGGALVGLMALATPYFGEYLVRILPALGRGTAVFDNQAPAGVALRAELFLFNGQAPPVHLAGAVTSALVVGVTLFRTAGRAVGTRRRAVVYASWTAAIPIASSITWTHHLATELVAFMFLAPSLAAFTRRWWLAVVAYPLMWLHLVAQVALVVVGVHSARDLGGGPLLALSAIPLLGMILLWLACLDSLGLQDE